MFSVGDKVVIKADFKDFMDMPCEVITVDDSDHDFPYYLRPLRDRTDLSLSLDKRLPFFWGHTDIEKVEPLTQDAALAALCKAIEDAREAGMTVNCSVIRVITTTSTDTL